MKWADYFEYRDGELFWKLSRSNRIKVGDRAGSLSKDGYRRISFSGKFYMEHRIIWEIHFGPIPAELHLDHKNRIKADNQIENLRLATRPQNQANQATRKDNTTGFKGVYFYKSRNNYLAQITIKGRVKFLGRFKTAEEASEVYEAKAKELRGEYYCA